MLQADKLLRAEVKVKVKNGTQDTVIPRCIHKLNLRFLPHIILVDKLWT